MESKCVSIIVPIYNGQEYIRKCIESIQNQTYSNLEIILVNDGSYDYSGEICDEYAKNDNRIKVYHVQNKGASPARNYGLIRASGHYIQFVDSDDYISEKTTQRLVNTMEKKGTDLVVCGYIQIIKELRLYFNQLDKVGVYTNEEYLCNTLRDPGHHYYGVVWNKLYLREIIRKNQILFVENASLGEDFIFNLHYLHHTGTVAVIKDRLYYYNCENENTLSRYKKSIAMSKRELENRYIIFEQYKNTFILSPYLSCKNIINRYTNLFDLYLIISEDDG